MSTKNYVLSVLALLLVLTTGASALVINTPTTWTARTAIATQTDGYVQIDAGGSLVATARVDLNGVALPAATKLIINGGTFTSAGTGADFCVHFPDNATGYPVYIVLNLGTASIGELRQDKSREARVEVGAGTMYVYSGYNPYDYIGASGYYDVGGVFHAGTGNGWMTPQTGFKIIVEPLGGDDYKIYGVASIYGENPTSGAVLIDRNPASVCFDSYDIEIAKVYFGPGDFNDLNYTPGCMPQLGSDITGLNPAGQQDVCTSLAGKIPLSAGRYSWAVEGYDTYEGEPNNLIQRRVFHFDVAGAPVVRVQPARQLVFGGGTAVFTAEVDSFNAPTSYNWYKGTPPSGTLVGTGTMDSLGSFRYRLTLTKTNVQWADKGDYYCTVANSDGSTNTATATLKVKAELAHWTFSDNLLDTADKTYNTTVYNGASYSGTGTATPAVYVASSGLDTRALSLDGTAAGRFVDLPDGFDDFTGGMTFAVWAKMDSTAVASVRYLDFATPQTASTSEPLNSINLARGNAQNLKALLFRGGNTVQFNNIIVTNTWQHFVTTMDADGVCRLYVDGVLSAQTATIGLPAVVTRTSNFIGRQNITFGGSEIAKFKGLIGDMRIFNYAVTADEAATMYTDVQGPYCRTKPLLDYNNSCIVELADFAAFAQDWLDCGLYPVSACP